MNKAVIYARVSSKLQERKATVDSQIASLKKQVTENNDVLVKEYIDNGYSGIYLDRPALNQLREDAKTDLFDVVYFFCADRIARDLALQTIIVGEMIKENKRVIINGDDYKENPENKFTLQVLGAVAELERAKIIERYSRGKMHKLRQGCLVGGGVVTYGYTYITKNGTEPARLAINEAEAEVVRWIFKSYADGASKSKIVRYLEDNRIPTKTGLTYWKWGTLGGILKNSSYIGIKYFNTRKMVKNSSNPNHKVKYGKEVFKDRSEWLPVKVPAIISEELFQKAQERLQMSKQKYMNPQEKQLLSNLVECGVCGGSCTGYRRFVRGYYRGVRTGEVYHRTTYVCSRTVHQRTHSKNTNMQRCDNSQISAPRLEARVLEIVKKIMTDVKKLKGYLNLGQSEDKVNKVQTERQLKNIEYKIARLAEEKRNALELYAKGKISRETYTALCKKFDQETANAKDERNIMLAAVPPTHKENIIDISLEHYCGTLKTRLVEAVDFDSQRQLLLEYIERISFVQDKMELRAAVPILLNTTDQTKSIKFIVRSKIPPRYSHGCSLYLPLNTSDQISTENFNKRKYN